MYSVDSSFQRYFPTIFSSNTVIRVIQIAEETLIGRNMFSCHLFLAFHAVTMESALVFLYLNTSQVEEPLPQIAWHLLEDEVKRK